MRMRPTLALLLYVAVCAPMAACCVPLPLGGLNIITHDERAAARVADRFADLAFVQKDNAGAYALLTPELQGELANEALADGMAKMHPAAWPESVAADEFEPMPGQRAMNIYLAGKAGDEAFFYRFVMMGDKGSGYRVGGLFRGNGRPASSNRRPLAPAPAGGEPRPQRPE